MSFVRNEELVASRAKSIAQQHIEQAIKSNAAHIWLSNAFGLREIPDIITKATSARKISLWGTRVSDISILGSLTQLRTLELSGLPITDITALSKMTSLEALDLQHTKVIDLSPLQATSAIRYLDISHTAISNLNALANHTAMRKLRLVNTQVEDITVLKNFRALEGLSLNGSPVSDIAALADLVELAGLHLSRTKVTDLSPIARLTALATDYRLRVGGPMTSVDVGLYVYDAPIADPYISTLRSTFNVTTRTYAILNRVRQQSGLPLLDVPASSTIETKSFDFSALPRQLPQDSFGAIFEAAEENLVMAPSGGTTDEETAAQPVTQQLHAALRNKVSRLTDRAGRLANQRGWEDLALCTERLNSALGANTTETAKQIGTIWAESVTLGSFLEQDARVRSEGSDWIEPLEAELLRSLSDIVETLGPWLRRFPTARLLDDDSAAYKHASDPTTAAAAVLTGAKKVELIVRDDAEIIDAALNAAERSGNQAKKANNWGQVSVRNISFAAIGLIAAGYATEVGATIASRSVIAQKAEEFVLEREAEMLEFLNNLPADIRIAVTKLIDRLRSSKVDD